MPGRLQIPSTGGLRALTLLLCLVALVAGGACATGLQEIRFWSLGDVTRVVVQVDGEFTYKWNRLEDPPRAFFDLPNVDLTLIKGARDRGRVQTIDVNDALLRQIRYAENSPGTARVVLDLNESCLINTSQLANPARLVIELRTRKEARQEIQVSRSGVVNGATPAPAEAIETNSPASVATTPPAKKEESARMQKSIGTNEPPRQQVRPQASEVRSPGSQSSPVQPPVAGVVSASEIATLATNQGLEGLDSSASSAAEKSRSGATANPVESPATTPDGGANPEVALAKPATRTVNGRQSLVRALGLKIGRVVIDPGHGGKDHGTTGVSGLKEKDLVLDISKRLADLVRDRVGSEVVLTREDDIFVSLEERTAIANRHRADLFISVHANSSPYKLASGSETFFLNFTTSREAMDVAARENASSERSVAELQDIVRKIALKDKRDESEDFAARIQNALYRTQRTKGLAKKNRGVKAAPFIVLVGAEMPSILVEIGFLSNAREEAELKKADYRQQIAEALLKGLETYMDSLSHFEGSERAAARE